MPNFNIHDLREDVDKLHAPDTSHTVFPSEDGIGVNDVGGIAADSAPLKDNILERCSLLGYARDLEAQIQVQKPFLGEVAVTGEASIWYAAPNTGKTLLAIHMIIDAADRGIIDPSKIFYIAADDSANGLVEKLHILEEYGVHLLAPGHQGFETANFVKMITKMTKDDAVNGLFIIADTVKKFVSLMDKTEARNFGDTIRRFVMKGGTFVGLAHTNKNRDSGGGLIYAGTTDLLEDFDCAYVIDEVEHDDVRKVVAFRNIKRRGNVASASAYTYSIEEGQSFATLLGSVGKVGDKELTDLYRQSEVRSDMPIIAAIERAIGNGVTSKMRLAKEVGTSERMGRNRVVAMIERYTGDDPELHRWTFGVGGHGMRKYVLLTNGSPRQSEG